ncbi:putative mitochondrial biogenesis protein AIM24 [Helianthus annuus]|nr:putative mitochondrial biogenesis protein AIM24 [Helianthus annuus]
MVFIVLVLILPIWYPYRIGTRTNFTYLSQQDDVTPFQILGGEAQIVQIMLKPDEKVSARPGCMCYMSGSTQMENVYAPENEAGMWQWLFGKHVTSTLFLIPVQVTDSLA